jgi:hypothetical protein
VTGVHYTIVTMTRGDGHRISEWVTYHAMLGFDDFQIVLDGDVDGTQDRLRALDLPAQITVHPKDEVGEYYDGLTPAQRRKLVHAWRSAHAAELGSGGMRGSDSVAWRQHRHFPAIMAPYAARERGPGWLALLDTDEFLVLSGHEDVRALTAEATSPRLGFLSFDVDTSGHDPGRPILEQHTMRWSRPDVLAHPDQQWAKRLKSLVRYRFATLTGTVHKISRGPRTVMDPDVARLLHFKVPAHELDIPFSVHDPVRVRRPASARSARVR